VPYGWAVNMYSRNTVTNKKRVFSSEINDPLPVNRIKRTRSLDYKDEEWTPINGYESL
jgi:hypothetical protein